MATGWLGRTNRVFPSVWLGLSAPSDLPDVDGLTQSALASGLPIDITSQPALWGGKLRGADRVFMAIGNSDFERATDESHACDLVQANLIEILSAVGREQIDFYLLRVRASVEEFRVSGALQALEIAKQQGHIGHIGLCCDGDALQVLGVWQFHDAFEIVLVPRNHYSQVSYETLAPIAKERRVGVVTSRPLNWGGGLPFFALPSLWRLTNLTQSFYGMSLAQAVICDLAKDHPVLIGVKSVKEVEQALAIIELATPSGLDAMLQPFKEAFDDPEEWLQLAQSSNSAYREIAGRRAS